jgi:hypothetical protein
VSGTAAAHEYDDGKKYKRRQSDCFH